MSELKWVVIDEAAKIDTEAWRKLHWKVTTGTWEPEQKPERQHVSDAAWEALQPWGGERERLERHHKSDGTVLLTVAEHDELLALRAEVERLNQALLEEKSEHGATLEMYRNERLRKGRDERASMADGETGVANPRVLVSGGVLCGVADQLDHRLGLGLPDGEPCEPMSARSWRLSHQI